MLLLTSTGDLLRLVTSSTASTQVHASWVDNAGGQITPGRTNTAIAAGTTTTVVGSPAADTQRTVRQLKVKNSHATAANMITVQHTDGTVSVDLFSVTLAAGQSFTFDGDKFALDVTERQIPLSASSGGRGIKVVATATAGTLIHTTEVPVSSRDEVWLYAYNGYAADVELTVEIGGATVPDNNVVMTIPAKSGLALVLPGLTFTGSGSAGLEIRAFAGVTNVIVLSGHVNRVT